jgi:hypothetical protein
MMLQLWSARMRSLAALGMVVAVLGCGKPKEPPVIPPEPPKPPVKTGSPAEPITTVPALAGPDHLHLIPADAPAFITLRVGEIWASDLATKIRAQIPSEANKVVSDFEKTHGMPIGDVRRVSIVLLGNPEKDPPLGIFSTAKPIDRKKLKELINPMAEERTEDGLKVFSAPKEKDAVVHIAEDNLVFFGRVADIKKALNRKSETGAAPSAGSALELAPKHHVVIAGDVSVLLKDIKKNPPPQVKPFAPLMDATTAYLTLDVGTNLDLKGTMAFPGDEPAKKAESVLFGLVGMGKLGVGQVNDADLQKRLGDTLDAIDIKQQGAKVNLTFQAKGPDVVQAVKTAVPMVLGNAGAAASRVTAMNNLKQIGLAMHNTHDATGALPAAAIYSKDGKPLLSWRVAILPYVEQQALYKEFKLDEPWDSPNNKKLIEKMPKIYALPGVQDAPGTTHFRVFLGPKAAFEGNKGLSIASFEDGTSNTMLVVEASQAVPWTKPDELTFDEKGPLPKLGALSPDGFLAVMADGSARLVKKSVSEKTLKAAITRNGKETLGQDWQ